MFLDLVNRRNRSLVDFAVKLHQDGEILPDTYVIDLDAVIQNAKYMSETANKEDVELYYMLKQIGRNPFIARALAENTDIKKAVVVDYKEALRMMEEGLSLGNVGHLVQIPDALLEKIISYGTDYITVYSLEKVQQIIRVANRLKKHQKLLLKVIEKGDNIYDGQYGGFHLSDLNDVIAIVKESEWVEIGGLTSFPCFLFDGKENIVPTNNMKTVRKAKEILEKEGIQPILNMPSATCSVTIPEIRKLGGHQGEPGHALTGTTPLHAVLDLPEIPALVYVSEISHNLDGHSYFYGGGYYRRGHFKNVEIVDGNNVIFDVVLPLKDESIDYYIETKNEHRVGATVIGSFRTQIFVTRSDLAIVSGLQSGNPHLVGIYDSLGNKVRR